MWTRLPPAVNRSLGRLIGRIRLPIRSGPNRGMWWSIASSGRGYGSGRFEASRINALVALLRPGDCVWDVGAHKGYVSLAASRAVGPAGRVLAFEPAEINRTYLERHTAWNQLHNVQLLPVALSDEDGTERFGGGGSTLAYQLGSGDTLVTTRRLDTLVELEGLPVPSVLKIDAEYAEAAVLRGARKYLSRVRLVWISIHTRALHAECRELLTAHGFRLFESVALRKRLADSGLRWAGDHELLAVGANSGISEDGIGCLDLFCERGGGRGGRN